MFVFVFAARENVYLQALLEAGSLVLCIFGNSGVRAAAFTWPRLPGTSGIPVLISRLLNLGPNLHGMVCIGLHQRLGREQTKVSNEGKNAEIIIKKMYLIFPISFNLQSCVQS